MLADSERLIGWGLIKGQIKKKDRIIIRNLKSKLRDEWETLVYWCKLSW